MTWKLDEYAATFSKGSFSGTIDLKNPQQGIVLACNAATNLSPVAGVSIADAGKVRLQDCYVRGNDLVIVYPQTALRPFNLQLQFRLVDLPMLTQEQILVEAWISNHTFLLESYPQIDAELCPLHSDLLHSVQLWEDLDGQLTPANTELMESTSVAALTIEATHETPAYVVMIHPLDQDESSLTVEQGGTRDFGIAALRLFGRFMEKGVIRRARFQILVSAQNCDESELQALYENFAASPLPLTT